MANYDESLGSSVTQLWLLLVRRSKGSSRPGELSLTPHTVTRCQERHPIAAHLHKGGDLPLAATFRVIVGGDQRLALRGKCFRCAKADHMIPSCSYPDSVKCNLCGATGHITPACGRRQVAQSAQQIPASPSSTPTSSSSHQLAIAYDGRSNFSADNASVSWPTPSSASSSISSSILHSV